MTTSRLLRQPRRRATSGVTLVELMVALVLGLVVAGAAMAVFLVNRQTYLATENLGRLQENARTAFELMAQDIRAAGMVPCSNEIGNPDSVLHSRLNNVVDTTEWWAARDESGDTPTEQWQRTSFLGYATADGDALQLISAAPAGVAPSVLVAEPTSNVLPMDLKVSNVDGISQGDLLLVCDYGYYNPVDDPTGANTRNPEGAIFQANTIAGTTIHVAESGSPGNSMSTPNASAKFFRPEPKAPQPNGLVAALRPTRWYIGDNARGGKSLFRSRLVNDAGALSVAEDEIVANADDMDLAYLVTGGSSYVAAAAIPAASWSRVVAVRIQLHMTGVDRVDGAQVERTLEHVVAVRNRVL